MNKLEIQQRILQNLKPLDLDKFEWGEKTRTFSTNETDLILDFVGIDNCSFKTSDNCRFYTGYNCTFDTGYHCTFKTGDNCTFKKSIRI